MIGTKQFKEFVDEVIKYNKEIRRQHIEDMYFDELRFEMALTKIDEDPSLDDIQFEIFGRIKGWFRSGGQIDEKITPLHLVQLRRTYLFFSRLKNK